MKEPKAGDRYIRGGTVYTLIAESAFGVWFCRYESEELWNSIHISPEVLGTYYTRLPTFEEELEDL